MLDTASGTQLMMAHVHTQLSIGPLETTFVVYDTGKLCSKLGVNQFLT